jgi:hypothetical protein
MNWHVFYVTPELTKYRPLSLRSSAFRSRYGHTEWGAPRPAQIRSVDALAKRDVCGTLIIFVAVALHFVVT